MPSRPLWVWVASVGCAAAPDPASFTADQRLDAAVGAEEGLAESHDADLCVAPNGTVYALWLDDREAPGVDELWMNVSFFFGDAATWLDAPVRVNQGEPGTGVVEFDVRCDDLGVFVIWEEDRQSVGGDHQIRFNRTVDLGATFLPRDAELGVDDGDRRAPRIDGDGDVLTATWIEGGVDVLFSISTHSGEDWQFPFVAELGANTIAALDVAASPDGAALVWAEEGLEAHDVYASKATPDGGTAPVWLASVPEVAQVAACADVAGAHVLWEGQQTAAEGLWSSASPDGGAAWSSAARLDTPAAPSIRASCAPAGDELQVAWEEAGAIELRAGADAVTFGGDSASTPIVARDPLTGDRAVGWAQLGPDGRADLYYAHADQALRLDSAPSFSSHKGDLDLAVHDGRVLALWIDDRHGTGDVFFTRLPLGGSSAPAP